MGIHSFYQYAVALFKAAIESHDSTKLPRKYDQVMLDVNYLLYNSAGGPGGSHSDTAIYRRVISSIKDILMLAPPIKSCFIAMDGPGPRAKLIVQRDRRLKAAEKAHGRDETLRFTPGTEFMHRFKHNLCLWVLTRLQYQDATENGHTKYFISGADREGEGEYKIFEHLRHHQAVQNDPALGLPSPAAPDDTFLIVGLDSDLILAALLHIDHVKVDVMRQKPSKKGYEIYNIALIKSIVCNALHGSQTNIIEDFVFLTLLNGCDYIPRLGGYVFLEAWRAYRNFKSDPANSDVFIINRDENGFTIDSEFLSKILKSADTGVTNFDHIVLALSDGSTKKLIFKPRDYKSILNTLTQAFLKRHEVRYETAAAPPSKAGQQFMSIVIAVSPDGKPMKLGSAVGLSTKTTEIEAAKQALELSNTLVLEKIQPTLTPESKALLRNYLQQQLSPQPDSKMEGVDVVVSKSQVRAVQTVDKAATVDEYVRMVLWTVEYYSGRCHSYATYFGQSGAAVSVLADELAKIPRRRYDWADLKRLPNLRPIQPSLKLAEDTAADPLQFGHNHTAPLVPLAFYMGVTPPSLIQPHFVPTFFKQHVISSGDIVRIETDNSTATTHIFDRSAQFIEKMTAAHLPPTPSAQAELPAEDASQLIKRRNERFLRSFLKFNPTLLFFRKNRTLATHRQVFGGRGLNIPTSTHTNHPVADEVTVHFMEKLKRNMKSNIVCVAETESHEVVREASGLPAARLFQLNSHAWMKLRPAGSAATEGHSAAVAPPSGLKTQIRSYHRPITFASSPYNVTRQRFAAGRAAERKPAVARRYQPRPVLRVL